MWCTKFSLILLYFELHSSLQHSLPKVAVNNDKEIFEIKQLPDDAIEFINTKPDEPTIREIIYYHIVEKPYKEEQETAKDDKVSNEADKTSQMVPRLIPSLAFDHSIRPFTNGQGFQFFDSHSEETNPAEKKDDAIDKSSDKTGIQDGEPNSKTITPSQDSTNKNSVEDSPKKQDITGDGRALDTSADASIDEDKKQEAVETTVPAIIDEKENPIKSRRKREISLGALSQGRSLPDFRLSGLPDYIQSIYKASPDFSKYFGSNNVQTQSNALYQPSIINKGNIDDDPTYKRNLNYIPAKNKYNPQNDFVYTNNALNDGHNNQQLGKRSDIKKSNTLLDMFNNIPNLLTRNGKVPTYGMDLHGGQGSVWNNIVQEPFVNIGKAFTQPRPKSNPDEIDNHKTAKTNIKRPEGVSSNDPDKYINDESNNNDDLPYFTDTGVEIPPAPKILEPRNDEAENINLNAANAELLPNSSLDSLKTNKLKENQGRMNSVDIGPISSQKYRENLRTNLNMPTNNKIVNPAFENNHKNSTKKAYINKKSMKIRQKKIPNSIKENSKIEHKQDTNPAFVNKNNVINDDSNAHENKFNSIPINNVLSTVPDLGESTNSQIIKRKSSTEAKNSNLDNNSDDINSKDIYYNKIKKSFENLLNKMSIFKPKSTKQSENDHILKENRPSSENKVPFDSNINSNLLNSHDDKKLDKESQPSSQSETTTDGEENSVKNNTLRENNTDKIAKSFHDIDKLMHSLSPKTKQGPAVQGTYGMRLKKDNGYVWNDLNPKHETFIHIDETTTEDVKKNDSGQGLSTESSVTPLHHDNSDDIESNEISKVHTNKYSDVTTKPIEILPSNSEELNTTNDKSSTIVQIQITTELIPETTMVETKEEITTEPSSNVKLTSTEPNIETTIVVNGEDLKRTDEVPVSKNAEVTTEPINHNIISTTTTAVEKSNKSTDITTKEHSIQELSTSNSTKEMPNINNTLISKDKDFENTKIKQLNETTDNITFIPKNTTDNNQAESTTTTISPSNYPNTKSHKKLKSTEKSSKNTNTNEIIPKHHKKDKLIKSDLNELLKKKVFWDWLSGWTSSYIKDLKKYTEEIVKEEVAAQIKNITHSWNISNEKDTDTNLELDNVSKPTNETQNNNEGHEIKPHSKDSENHDQKDAQNTIIPEKSEDSTGNKTKIPTESKNTSPVKIDGDTIYGNTVGVTNVFIFLNDTALTDGSHNISNLNDTIPKVTNFTINKSNITKNISSKYPLHNNETIAETLSTDKLPIDEETKAEALPTEASPIETETKAEPLSTEKPPLLQSDLNVTVSTEITTNSPDSTETTTIINKSNNNQNETTKDQSSELKKEIVEKNIIHNTKKEILNKTNVTEASILPNTTQKDNTTGVSFDATNITPTEIPKRQISANENNLNSTKDNNISTDAYDSSPPKITSTESPVSTINPIVNNNTNSTKSVELPTTATPQTDDSTKLNTLSDKETVDSINLNNQVNKKTETPKVDDSTTPFTPTTTLSPKTEPTKRGNSSEVNNSTENPAESTTISKLKDELKVSTTELPQNDKTTKLNTITDKSNGNLNNQLINSTTEIGPVDNSTMSTTVSPKVELTKTNNSRAVNNSTETLPAELLISKFNDQTKTSTTEAPHVSNSTNVKFTKENSTLPQPTINIDHVNKSNLSETANLTTETTKFTISSIANVTSTESTKADTTANSTLKEHPSTELSSNEKLPKLNSSITSAASNTSDKNENNMSVPNKSEHFNSSTETQPDKNITNINNKNTTGNDDTTNKTSNITNYTVLNTNSTESPRADNSTAKNHPSKASLNENNISISNKSEHFNSSTETQLGKNITNINNNNTTGNVDTTNKTSSLVNSTALNSTSTESPKADNSTAKDHPSEASLNEQSPKLNTSDTNPDNADKTKNTTTVTTTSNNSTTNINLTTENHHIE